MSVSANSRPRAPSLLHEIWVRRWSVAAIAALATASAIYYSMQLPPSYAAESRVLVSSVEVAGSSSETPSQPNMATEEEIARSTAIVRIVRERLDRRVPEDELIEDLSIENPDGTEILVLTFTHPDPAVAKEAAQAFAEEYIKLRSRGVVQSQLASAQEIQTEIAELTEELQRIDRRIGSVASETVLTSLISRANLLTGLLVQGRQELISLRTPPDVGELLQAAAVLGRVGPSYSRNVPLALMLGLALGVAQAGLRGRVDDKLHSVEEAEPYLRSSALALIPSLPGLEQKRSTSTVSSNAYTSISDAFVPLRIGFLAAASRREATAFVITGASAGEGKSTVTANLAISLARAGRRVTVICADPDLHRLEHILGARADIGLTQVLDGSVPLSEALLPNRISNLNVLPCGRATGGDAELSQSDAMEACFDSIRERSGFVLVDSPPLGHADAASLLPLVDAVLFVVDSRHMHARRLAICRRQLDRLDADMLGIVFNRASRSVIRPDFSIAAAPSSA
jgi:capsular exopolysaccharide synthesis family protein